MATNDQIKKALVKAAEKVSDKGLTTREADDLFELFGRETGSPIDRATRAIGRATNKTPKELGDKRASDDDADRAFRDLEDLLRR